MDNRTLESTFTMLPDILMQSKGFVSPLTGESVNWSVMDKMTYLKLKLRNKYFQEHYDTLEGLADMFGVDYRTISRSVRKLRDYGAIDAEDTKHKGLPKIYYKNIPHLMLVAKDGTVYSWEDINTKKVVDKSVEIEDTTHKQKKPAKIKQIIYGDEPF